MNAVSRVDTGKTVAEMLDTIRVMTAKSDERRISDECVCVCGGQVYKESSLD